MHATTDRSIFRRTIQVVLAGLFVLVTLGLTSSPAHADNAGDEQNFLAQTNAARAQNGLAPLAWDDAAAGVARGWASQLAGAQTLSHNPNLVSQINELVTSAWRRIGENVGFGPSVDAIQTAFLNSAPHTANILGDYNRVGLGVVRDGTGKIWVTVDLVKVPALDGSSPAPPGPAGPPPIPSPVWFLRNTLTTGIADSSFTYGNGGDKVVACDWNGDGIDTTGLFRHGWWYLTNQNPAGSVTAFAFGSPGDIPICGDWNGDGIDTVGVYRNGTFYLRDSNSTGIADIAFPYGNGGDMAVVGDWNGDGTTTVGVLRASRFFLKNSNTSGSADLAFIYGDPGDRPLAGDWNGDGITTIGIWRNGQLFLRNSNTPGFSDYIFGYGNPGDIPVIGDWSKSGKDVLGAVRGAS